MMFHKVFNQHLHRLSINKLVLYNFKLIMFILCNIMYYVLCNFKRYNVKDNSQRKYVGII